MTDKEIIKASKLVDKLRDAYNDYYDTSKSMPYDIDTTLRESAICLENALNEINRQQAEIERLTINMNAFGLGMKQERERADTIRAEAIKEFAERLKKEKYSVCAGHGMSECVVSVYDINNLVKEMVGDDK